MKEENRKREVSATTSPKVRARQSRLYQERKAFGASRINPYATFGCYVTAKYPYPSAFFFLQTVRHHAIPPFLGRCYQHSVVLVVIAYAEAQRKSPQCGTKGCVFSSRTVESGRGRHFVPRRRLAPNSLRLQR